jgi:acyl-CoA thioesterase YciA
LPDRIPVIRATAMPTHLNPYGGVFGGWLISQMALGAGSEASRVVRGKAVLVAADELRFKGAPSVGDEVSVYVELLESGRTSLTYQAEAISRERHGDAETRVAWGRFKFVALGEDDRPRELPSPLEGEGGSRGAVEG